MNLTQSQQFALDTITQHLKEAGIILLCGSAGTGKTTLTKQIARIFLRKNINICGIAPTHKSKRVLQASLNTHTLLPIPAFTVASVLGKIKSHSYIGTKTYTNSNSAKLSTYDMYILDEVSMVANNDLHIIIDYVTKSNKMLLIVGDPYQIPSPSAHFTIHDNFIQRDDSFIFTHPDILMIRLTEIVRQNADSPIIQLATYVRDNINSEFTFEETGFTNTITLQEAYDKFKSVDFANSKIIAYTNQAVKSHNIEMRRTLGYTDQFVKGDILTGYVNIGFPELIIENSRDYIIHSITPTETYAVAGYKNLEGTFLDINPVDAKAIDAKVIDAKIMKRTRIFIIDIHSDTNYDVINELINRAEKSNAKFSKKEDYLKYVQLKYELLFMEDIYKYDECIYTETSFRKAHPLLFTRLDEVLCNRKIVSSNLFNKIDADYPEMIQDRIIDNKNISDSETFADKFKVVEKDLYYGYAITAHKSQGSTYTNVLVDEPDFNKIQNRMNYKYNKLEYRIREKNQLRYVAYTRAKNNLYVIRN